MLEQVNEFFSNYAALFTVVGVIAGLVLYWKNGGFVVSRNIIENFRTRVDQLEKDVVRLTGLDQQKSTEIGRLNGVIQEKDSRIKLLEDLVKDRNPEMVTLLKTMNGALVKIENFMEQLHERSARNEVKMDEQTELLKKKKGTKK